MRCRGFLPLASGLVLCSALTGSGAFAQGNQDKPIDFKRLVPPVLPALPPNSQLNSGVVGGSQTPYTTAPLYDATPTTPPAPGLKLTVPSR
jgi:hypothetical protein